MTLDTAQTMLLARKKQTGIPAFNISNIPMMKPIVQAVVDENSLALIEVARVEWEKFSAKSLERVAEEYHIYGSPEHTMLHLDHVPVIDEDHKEVDYLAIIERAIIAGFGSVMVDGSRLPFAENVAATRKASDLAHSASLPCEAELGSVMGHESGEMMPYEEIFSKKAGFTKLDEAATFVAESGCDWLSVAVGNIHGAIAEATRDQKKPEARLDIEHIAELYKATGVPLVLHGGSGVNPEFLTAAIKAGITKINVGTEIRQVYERGMREGGGVEAGREALYNFTRNLIHNVFKVNNSRKLLFG